MCGRLRVGKGFLHECSIGRCGHVCSASIAIELQDLCLQRPQLGTESGNTRTGNLGHPLIICIGSNPEQLLDTLASDRRDNSHRPAASGVRCLSLITSL